MKELEFNSITPLYLQIYNILCSEIRNGILEPGEKIPSENDLCTKYHVSRVTVRASLDKMVQEGILAKKTGKGAFVAGPVFVESALADNSFTQSCKQMGAAPKTQMVFRDIIKADKDTAHMLHTEREEGIICIKRVRLIDNIPAIFEIDYFCKSAEFMMQADVEHITMRQLIAVNMHENIESYQDTFDVALADKEQAGYLNCMRNTPLLRVAQQAFSENDTVIYYNEQYILSEIYKYVSKR